MNRKGHWGIWKFGHSEMQMLRWKFHLPTFLLFLISQFPTVLFSQQHPLSLQADQQFEQREYDAALVTYNQLIQEFPERKEGYFNRGLCLYKTEKYSEAIFDFDEAFKIDSLLTDAQVLKAFSLEKQGDQQAAMFLFQNLFDQHTMPALLNRRIKNHELAVMLSSKWYYMIALALLLFLLVTVVAKTMKRI